MTPDAGGGTRRIEGNTLVSTAAPPLRLRIDPRLPHLESTELTIKGLALAERHYFVEAREGRVRRMLVAQFEGFLPTNDERYVYRLPDPVTLGGETYGSWVFCYARRHGTGGDPSPEGIDTSDVLARHDLAMDEEVIMARYARIVGEDARREILLFYTEPLRPLGHTLGTIATDDGEVRPAFASVAADLKARARRTFEILPLED